MTASRQAALAGTISQLLEREHLLRKKIDDGVSRAAFETYVDRLDPTKMFLLRTDRDALARHAFADDVALIPKPFTTAELLAQVARVFQR